MSDQSTVSGPNADLVFYVNGKRIVRNNVDPKMLLADFLRAPDIGLTGTKIGCKQGGCGACTVLLSEWDESTQSVKNSSINACMRPLAALDGMMITTVEGTGSVKSDTISTVQECLAKNNGTQCGFCTPGWVMTMTAAIAEKGPKPGTKVEIEGMFDGNICRCTGYRPILYGFKKAFASDWNPDIDERDSMTCMIDPAEAVANVMPFAVQFPNELRRRARTLAFEAPGYQWFRPTTLDEALALLARFPERDNVRLVGGNTSIGIYPATVENPHIFIDLGHVPELREGLAENGRLQLGAGMRYNELLALLDREIAETAPGAACLRGVLALRYLAGRTAGSIVRNAATLAGNTMLVVRHGHEGVPFPSDCFTALATLGAQVITIAPGWDGVRRLGLLEFAAQWAADPAMQGGCLLLRYEVPATGENDYAQTYKTAQRIVNSHAIVNGGLRVRLDADNRVTEAVVVMGGIAPVACRLPQCEETLLGQVWGEATLGAALAALAGEVDAIIARHADHYANLPDEGFSAGYKRALCVSYLYKFILEVSQWRGLPVPEALRSAARRDAPHETRGTQAYATDEAEYPANQPFIKIGAYLQATGEAQYVHDIALPRRGLNGAPVQSTIALGTCTYRVPGFAGPASAAQVLEALRQRFPGVVDYVTATDVPQVVVLGIGGDEPLFAISVEPSACPHGKLPANYDACAPLLLTGFGQAIGMVLAENEQEAQEAAWHLQSELCLFAPDPLTPPVLDLPDTKAERLNSVFLDLPPFPTHIWQITRERSNMHWLPTSDPTAPDPSAPQVAHAVPVAGLAGAVPCTRVSSKQKVGSQIHFYMETQSCVAEVLGDRQLRLHPSTQSPDSVHSAACQVIGLDTNQVSVHVRRVGGGYGGKCDISAYASSMAAVAAWKQDCTVRLALLRQVDSAMFGHRHPVLGNYHIAIGDASNPATHGKLLGFQADFWLDGGRTYECSMVVSDCLALRSDTAYNIPNWNCAADVCRTNKTSNTSMRTMGMLQAVLIVEDAVEAAADSVGLASHTVRENNLYVQGDSTPYGEPLDSCYMREVWDYTVKKADFHARQRAVDAFNASNRWRKRGISLLPVKYGSGFNLAALEQGGALIEVYSSDGMVLARHGGVEMGQGLDTKVAQVVAQALNVPMRAVRVAECDTAVVPNPEGTGASTGTSFNAGAAQEACQDLRQRLESYCHTLLDAKGSQWCADHHVNFWDYPELGWRTEVAQADGAPPKIMWQYIIGFAHGDRINLSAQARIAVPGGTEPDTGLTFKEVRNAKGELVQVAEDNDYFNGYTFSAACTEVEIDVLTGETTILRADVVYDAGISLNPAVDVGQVEGGFVQGLGYVLSEELTYQPAGSPIDGARTRPAPGALYTVNTWEYKPPAAQSIPLEMNIILFPRDLAPLAPQDPNDLLSSKEIGEPPMTLAATAFFAVKKAIQAARADRGHGEWFQMESPATVERVRQACLVEAHDLAPGSDLRKRQ
jgi:xanthine dehydrogenase/oxidase